MNMQYFWIDNLRDDVIAANFAASVQKNLPLSTKNSFLIK